MNPWEKYAAKPSSGPWEKRQATPPIVATTKDGGKVYRMGDGSLSFSSPGMSTNNQETIAKIMEGATPADASTYGNVSEGGKVGTAVRSAVQGMTFGGGDELVAGVTSALGPNSYEAELQRERARLEKGRDKNTGTAAISEIAGALLVPLPNVAAAGTRAQKIAKSAGAGGLLSGIYGYLSGEGGAENRLDNAVPSAAWGAGIGAAIPAIGGVAQRILDGIAKNKAIANASRNAPSTEALRRMGEDAYKAVDDAGVVIAPDAFKSAADGVVSRMRAQGMDTGPMSLTPQSARVAEIVSDAGNAGQPVPFRELDLMRRKAGIPASNLSNNGEAAVGSEAISALDDFVNNLNTSQVTQGDAQDLPQLIDTARNVWAKMRRSQLIDDAIANSENYLSGGASGIRNQFARILKNPKLVRGFSEAEQAAMRRVVNGSLPEQALNLISGGMGQLGTMGGAGATGALIGSALGPVGTAIGGVVGAGVGAGLGSIARRGAENVAAKNAETVRALIANGGLAQLPAPNTAARALIEKLVRQGMAAGLQQ